MLWPVRIHAQPPWRGEHPLRGLYSPMDLTTRRKYPDFHLIHVLHGFWWHYGSLVRPGLEAYPEDIFRSLCEPWLDPYEYNEHVHTSMFKECRHGVGHGLCGNQPRRVDGVEDGATMQHERAVKF